jgi:flagellar hook-length control protein FliK
MMDMKSPVSLSNTRAPKAEAPIKADNNSQSESSDFDRHLSQQIEKAEPKKAPSETHKTEENQVYKEDTDVQQSSETEAGSIVVEGQQIVDEYFLAADETGAELPVSDSTEEAINPLLIEPEKEQIMPLVGNVLPREAQAEKVTNKDQPLKINLEENSNQTSRNTSKQPLLAEVLADDTKEKRPNVEFKAEVKTQQIVSNNQQVKPGINIATLAAAASVQQHVPQATTSATIHMQSVTAGEGFTSSPTLSGGIAAAVQSPNWSRGLTERVSWMMQGNMQTAELKLNPAHLGPLEVKLSIQDDKASITFVTGHAQVKEAIDTAMPRLREMLEQQGLDLTDVDVSQYSDAKDEQADTSEQNENMNGAGVSDAEQQAAALHESMINVNVNQGLSIFV